MTKKDTQQLYIIGGLISVLVFFIVKGMMDTKKPPPKPKSPPLASQAAPTVTSAPMGIHESPASRARAVKQSSQQPVAVNIDEMGKGLFARLSRETKELDIGRDPFSKVKKKTARGPYLSGISWEEENPMAVINGEIVGIGSEIAGYVVVDVQQDRVILNKGMEDFELRMHAL